MNVTSVLTKLEPTRAVETGLEKWFVTRYVTEMPDAVHYTIYIYSHDVSWLAVLTSSGN
jgi:hypothetical protein